MAFTLADLEALEKARLKLLTGQMPGQISLGDKMVTFVPTRLSELNAMISAARMELGIATARTVAGNTRRPAR